MSTGASMSIGRLMSTGGWFSLLLRFWVTLSDKNVVCFEVTRGDAAGSVFLSVVGAQTCPSLYVPKNVVRSRAATDLSVLNIAAAIRFSV